MLNVRIYRQRLRSYISLISHPYSDLLAPYLGTTILTILYVLKRKEYESKPPILQLQYYLEVILTLISDITD